MVQTIKGSTPNYILDLKKLKKIYKALGFKERPYVNKSKFVTQLQKQKLQIADIQLLLRFIFKSG